MKKKRRVKLELKKKTVRALGDELANVRGGAGSSGNSYCMCGEPIGGGLGSVLFC